MKDSLHYLERYGERRRLNTGDVLFSEGDRHIPMFAIVSGTIEATRGSGDALHVLGFARSRLLHR